MSDAASAPDEGAVIRAWNAAEAVLMSTFAILALLLVVYEVAVRYFFPAYLPDWGSEFVIYFTVWAIFIAGSSLVHEHRHIRADIVILLLPTQVQRLLEIFSALVGLAFCAIVGWYAWQVVDFAHRLDERSESSILFPLYLYYLCMPVGFALMSIRYLLRIKRYLFNFDPDTMTARARLEHPAGDK